MAGTTDEITILHVDDEPDLADAVASFLERQNERFTVLTTTSAADARQRLETHAVDCLVSDYDMPGQNGIELLETVRERHPNLPFILYTGKGSEEIASDAISAGVTDYLQKEAGTDHYTVLANRITNAVEHYRSRQKVEQSEQRLREIIDVLPHLLYVVDSEGQCLLANETLASFHNTTIADIEGANATDILSEPMAAQFMDDITDVLETGEPSHVPEVEVRDPDGATHVFEAQLHPHEFGEIDTQTVLGVATDITERKEHERRLETVISNLPGIVYRCRNDPDWPMEFVRGDCESMTGYAAEALETGEVVWGEDVLHPADEKRAWAAVQEGVTSGEPFEVTYRITTADGATKWLWERGQLVTTPSAENEEMLEGFITDITDRKEREEELEEINTLLSTLFETLPVGVLAEDESRNVLTANDRLLELFGMAGTPEDVVGTDCERLAREVSDMFADPDGFVEGIAELVATSTPVDDEELALEDGRTFARTHHPIDLPDGEGHLWVYRDITDRKNRERILERTERQYRTLAENMPNGAVLVFDADMHYQSAYGDLFADGERDLDEFEGRHLTDVFSGEMLETKREMYEATLSGETRQREIEFEGRTFQVTTIPVRDDQDAVFGGIVMAQEVTARKQRERRLRALNETSQELMSAETREQVATLGIEAAREILGLDSNAIHLYNEQESALVPVAQTEKSYEHVGEPPTFTGGESIAWQVYESGDPLAVDDVRDHPKRYNPDTPMRSELFFPIGDAGILIAAADEPAAFDQEDLVLGEILVGAIETALEQVEQTDTLRARERELTRQNERLDEFASVVSHDLRNPLQVAKTRLGLVRTDCESDHIDDVASALDRMDALIDDLLTLAREGDQVGDLERVDPAAIAATCWSNVATGDATIVTDTDREILADRSRFQQLLENLVRNAIEHGGDSVTVTIGELEDGLFVADDGTGIADEKRAEVFDVGYTTTSEGSGFGLSIVEQVAEAHGWSVAVTEGDSGGARFEITGVTFADG